MKTWKGLAGVLLCCALLLGSGALADGYPQGHTSRHFGQVYFSTCTGNDDGYVNTDGVGGITAADPYFLTVISKSASIWAEPRTNSKKLASASFGDTLMLRAAEGSSGYVEQGGFYGIDYKGQSAWVNKSYVVRNTLEIVLMESNVPAYIAPDTNAKKVGSLAKHTRYRVVGIYDDFYIINLRGAAVAFIPMSVRHYDTFFESNYHTGASTTLTTIAATTMRTGPGDDYAAVKDVKAGAQFSRMDVIDGWYMVTEQTKADGLVYAFIPSWAAQTKDGW